MSALGLKLLSGLACDPDVTVIRDDTVSTPRGSTVKEVIRVRVDGCDYDVEIVRRP